MRHKIVVTGAGPAGVVTALGLHRLGYEVFLISRPRRFASIEGISARVLQALQQQQLHQALQSVEPPGVREVNWNGEQHAQNREWLVDRQKFDEALWEDAKRLGVPVYQAGVMAVEESLNGWCIKLDTGDTLTADFWVEARGRSAPKLTHTLRGPETLSILNRWHSKVQESATAIHSGENGWVWGARLASGLCYWQYTVDASDSNIPKKSKLLDFCRAKQQGCAVTQQLFSQGVPEAVSLHVRAGTSVLSQRNCGTNWLRIGDAAMAVDSLSGNGIFQSLSSALQAPAVINTLIKKPEWAEVAQQFHQQRIEHLFYRFARMGREFYSEETRFDASHFWQARQQWPDLKASHQAVKQGVMVAKRGVIENYFIREREVVITPDQPLGVWHLNGVELAPLVKRRLANETWVNILSEFPQNLQNSLMAWLASEALT